MGTHDGESTKDELYALNDAHRSLETADPFALITEEEKQKLLYDWNDTTRPYPRNKTIQRLFEEQVVLYPTKIAIRHNEQSITYLALNEKANQLARLLRAKQTDLGQFIAICMDKRIDAIVAMLAVLKTGRAYLPIDPEYPLERIHFMLKDSAARVVLTSKAHLNTLQRVQQDGVECIDVCSDVAEGFSDENLSRDDQAATDLAYLMYTSGSTGVPKGVLIPHRGVVRFARSQNYINIKAEHVVAQCASFSFDMAAFEIWIALLNGAELVFISKKELLSPEKMLRTFMYTKVTVAVLVTTVYHQLLIANPEIFSKLDYLVVGGEVLASHLVKKHLKRKNKPNHIINGYGPTENTAVSVCYELPAFEQVGHTVPIGKPVANTKCYVVDEYNRLLPIGVMGELCVAGDGLAKGYRNRCDMTRERFIHNPFDEDENARLYKTGDFAAWNVNGNLEFFGRADGQVKIRGFRIEIEEVELAICSIAAVRMSFATLLEQAGGRKILAAFVVFHEQESLEEDELKARLLERLPAYMMPTQFYIYTDFPVSISGKIDRKKLITEIQAQKNQHALVDRSVPYGLMGRLLRVWRDVFKQQAIDEYSDFFSLGGDSLLAMQIISELYKYGICLEVSHIFSYPKIKALFSYLEKKNAVSILNEVGIDHSQEYKPTERQEDRRLSPVQMGMLYYMLNDQSALYQGQFHFAIYSDLSPDLVKMAWKEVIDRHDMLRSVFVAGRDNVFERHISEKIDFSFVYKDFSFVAEARYTRILNEFLCADRLLGAVIDDKTLPRISLIRFSSTYHVLVFTHHHLVIDGWALNVLLKEFFIIHKALLDGKKHCLVPAVSYDRFVSWIYSQSTQAAEAFWKQECSDFHYGSSLTNAPSYSASSRYRCGRLAKHFSVKRSEQLRCLLKQYKVTFSSVFQVIWAIALSKKTACSDIVYGLVVSLLPKEVQGVEAMVGPVMNVVPLHVRLNNDEPMIELIQRVQEKTSEVLKFAHYPLYKIKEQICNLNRDDVFETIFAVENYASYPETNLSVGRVNVYDTNHYPLAFQVFPDHKIGMELVFNKQCFSKSQIKNIMSCLVFLFNALIDGRHTSFEEAFYSRKCLKQFLSFGNSKRSSCHAAEFKSVVSLFENQTKQRGNFRAVKCGKTTLSYEQLNKKANKLANYLIKAGLLSNDIVAILADRSVDTVVAILAVLKAGAAYVPIDPRYPKSRVDYILNDASICFFLIDKQSVIDLDLGWGGPIVCLEDIAANLALESDVNPDVIIAPGDLAYIIYTSGSTGHPKGVLIEHKNIISLFSSSHKHFKFNAKDIWVLFHSFSFDVSVWEMWGCLLYGGALVIATDDCITSSAIFYDLLVKEKITVLCQTPSFFNMLVHIDREKKEKLYLRFIILAGEALRFSDVAKWYENHDDRFPKVINMYGLTEATVHSTYKKLNKNIVTGNNRGLIGRPLANSFFIVFDEHHNMVDTHGIGELFVGGVRLSRGYLNREELTEKVYIQHPVYGRLYKTGDLMKVLPDNELEYVGRNDFQIKLHGFRVELGELESAVLSFQGVKQAVVMLRGESERSYLVAYIATCSKEDKHFNVQQLREHLFSCLPSYMVPALFVLLDALPMTLNGKVDRKKLIPLAASQEPSLTSENELPTKDEAEIIAIYSQVLQVATDKITATSNFFELGGNSLLVMMATNFIQKQMDVKITIQDFLEAPMPRRLSHRIDSKHRHDADKIASSLVLMRQGDDAQPLFLVHPIGGSVLCYVPLVKALRVRRTIYGIQDPGLSAHDFLFESIEQMASFYLEKIQEKQQHGPYFLCGYSLGATLVFEIANQLRKQGEKVQFLGLLDGWAVHPDVIKSPAFLNDYLSQYREKLLRRADAVNYALPKPWLALHVQRNTILLEYKYAKLDVEVILLKAESILPVMKDHQEEYNYWKPFSTFPIVRHIVPGDHDTMMEERNVFVLADEIDAYL